MIPVRVMPCLLLQDGGLVKTQRFGGPVYLGDPINTLKLYNDMEVDEIILLDITASRQQRQPDWELLEQAASECFMPLCYGGGVNSEETAARLFSLGIEKVALNHAALEMPGLLGTLAARFGSQSVIAALDVKKNWMGRKQVWNHVEGKSTGQDPLTLARQYVEAGAGELLVNSVDRDGQMRGYDVELMAAIAAAVPVPVIACGGAGNLEHMRQLALLSEVRAMAAGSMFVFQGPHRAVLIQYPRQSELKSAFAALAGHEKGDAR